MNDNHMKTILSGVKEWTENLTDDAIDKANNALEQANKSIDKALFVVNITTTDGVTFNADKTFNEIVQAYNEGKYNIVAITALGARAYIMPLLGVTATKTVFNITLDGILFSFIITSNNEVQKGMLQFATTDSKLPNPYPLTFTGAVSETYDGSSAKTIEIPIGADGITPTIGENGNWYLGSTDTGKPSRGEKGDTGATGATGAIGPQGPKGDTGETGPAGIGVPDGGTEGQLLGKTSDGPAWVDMPESGLPTGGAPYQQLVTDGTGKATWEDRTHWVEQRAAELIPEQTLSGGMSMGTAYMFNVSYFTIIPNLEYTVVFDGVEYKCISAELSGSTYIGNATLLGAPVEDTGEPFLIVPISGMSVITATDGPHTIALSGWSIVYHQLLLDYIPNGKFLNGFIEHSSLTMTRDEVSRYREILSKSLFPMLVWQDFLIKRISTGTSHGVNVIYITDYDGALYTITENSDGLYSVDDANNGYNYLYIKKGNISKSRLLLVGGKPVSIEGIEETSGNALDYTTFCVKKTGSQNGQDFEVLGNGTVKAYSVILPSSTAGSTKKFKITVDDSGTISATEIVAES